MSYHGFADKEAFDRALDAHITREPPEYRCDECGEYECIDSCRCENCQEELADQRAAEQDALD
jgi:hypothetical protein